MKGNGKKIKHRSCSTCHARKVKCDLLKTCSACLRHAKSQGRDENSVVCVYSHPMNFAEDKPVVVQEEVLEPRRSRTKRRKLSNEEDIQGLGLGRDARRGSEGYGTSDDDYSDNSDYGSPSNEYLPTPKNSPSSSSYSLVPEKHSLAPEKSLSLIPLFSPITTANLTKSIPKSLYLNLTPFDFNAFYSQPYDSPISEFHFGSTGSGGSGDGLKEIGFFEEYPSPASM